MTLFQSDPDDLIGSGSATLPVLPLTNLGLLCPVVVAEAEALVEVEQVSVAGGSRGPDDLGWWRGAVAEVTAGKGGHGQAGALEAGGALYAGQTGQVLSQVTQRPSLTSDKNKNNKIFI